MLLKTYNIIILCLSLRNVIKGNVKLRAKYNKMYLKSKFHKENINIDKIKIYKMEKIIIISVVLFFISFFEKKKNMKNVIISII